MFLLWSFLVVAVALLAVQQCAGETSCVLWSSAEAVVPRGSSFTVYCTFDRTCKISRSMQVCVDGCSESVKVTHESFNATTISLRVENITEKRTYSCFSDCKPPRDSCGLDISAGYPPDRPKNISCNYTILRNDAGRVNCSWDGGRDTHLRNNFTVWVTPVIGNRTGEPVPMCNVANKGSADFTLPRSVRLMSVWVRAQNTLGSVESLVFNYTLSDIVMPSTPVVDRVECSSRNCSVKVVQPVRTQHLQIQYRGVHQQEWTIYPDQAGLSISSKTKLISALEPCSSYSFKVRSRFSSGFWSPWSSEISNRTEEEAPAQPLDVWLLPGPTVKVYWNESIMSVCRESIIQYRITVNTSVVAAVSSDVKNHVVPSCTIPSDCEVTVQAVNSKGSSPPATITTRRTEANAPLDVNATPSKHTVTISWRTPETAPAYYVVEWYLEGPTLDELRWVRLNRSENLYIITDMKPCQCYEGAVYAFYNESSVSRTSFTQIATSEAAPETGPIVEEKVSGNTVTVKWKDLPRPQRGGCIASFTIYLQNSKGNQTVAAYSAKASERTFTIKGLAPDFYSLWMSASTSKGEGPASKKVKFYIVENDQLSPVLMCLFVTMMGLVTLCLWKCSAAKQRLREIFRCLVPDVVPDPANSKWAKECTKEKGKMNLQLPSHNSSFTEPEDETLLVDVEELGRQTATDKETKLSAVMYPPLTTYIKSLSHDSDSSSHTQTSLDTTVDYISSHGQENLDNYDSEDEEDFQAMHFFPRLGLLTEPVGFGGKLTLDAVKIDCSDFFQNA